MAIHEVTYYQAKCDGCGHIEDDYGEYTAFGTPGCVVDMMWDSDWTVDDDKMFCENCKTPAEEDDYDVHGDVDE